MTKKHLAAGSAQPPKGKDLRLYGMRYCPYVQRVRMVLNAKGLSYDEVYVDLKNKPDWLFKLHPEGKVPALDTGDEILIESLDISEYLDKKYPEPPLYPKPERRDEDKKLVSKFGQVITVASKASYGKDNKPISEFLEEARPALEELEAELAKRGTTFFSGAKPGMVDFMMWPWAERSKLPALLRKQDFSFPKEKFPKLVAWRLAMQEDPAVKPTIIDTDKSLRFVQSYVQGGKPDYLDDEF